MPSHHKGLAAPQNNFLDTIVSKFDGTHSNFLLCNARGNKTCPIVYCSDDFCQLTGYTKSEIMGKPCTCSFLYGSQTDAHARQLIQVAVNFRTEAKTEILLYRKDGTSYRCWFELVPIKNEKGQEVLFLVLQKNIDEVDDHANHTDSASRVDMRAEVDKVGVERAASSASQSAHDRERNGVRDRRDRDRDRDHDHDRERDRDRDRDRERDRDRDREQNRKRSKAEDADRRSQIYTISPANQNRSAPADSTASGLLNRSNSRPNRFSSRRKIFSNVSDFFSAASKRCKIAASPEKSKLNSTFQSFTQTDTELAVPQYKTEDLKHRRLIVRHYGIFRIAWDWMCLLCTFYIAVMVPYYAAFLEQQEEDRDFLVTDIIVEMLFIIDIILNFLTTYVNRSGKVVYDLQLIAWNYLKGWFILDLSAAIPFELLHALNITTGIRINLLKLARMLRLARLLQKIDRYSQYSAVVLALLMSMFTLVAHWFACIWYVIGTQETSTHPANWTVGWLHDLATRTQQPFGPNRTAGPNLPSCYITSLYFSTSSLTSVGFGNVSANTIAEKIFSVCAMLIGALMHAAVFGNVTAIIQRMYSRRAAYQTKANDLKEFARIHRLPKHLKQRMYEFFQITWSVNHGLDTSMTMKDFPEELRCDISLHLYREILALPIFSEAPYGCIKRIAYECVRYRFCTPNELLVNDSDQLSYLYFIASGSVEILRNGQVVCILGKGDIFGTDFRSLRPSHVLQRSRTIASEYDNWIRQQLTLLKSRCDARTMTYCDIYLIDVEKLLFNLMRYPEFGESFCNKLQVDISYNLLYADSAPVATTATTSVNVATVAASSSDNFDNDDSLQPIVETEEIVSDAQEATSSGLGSIRTQFQPGPDSGPSFGPGPASGSGSGSGGSQKQCGCRLRCSQTQQTQSRASDRHLQSIQAAIKEIKENLETLNSKMDRLTDVFLRRDAMSRLRDEARQFSFIDDEDTSGV